MRNIYEHIHQDFWGVQSFHIISEYEQLGTYDNIWTHKLDYKKKEYSQYSIV